MKMITHKKFSRFTITLFTVFLVQLLIAQTTQSPLDLNGVLIIESPAPKFKPIHLPSHKGLPRFGAQNFYQANRNQPREVLRANQAKKKLLEQGYLNYCNLLEMKYLSSYFDDMDKEYLTVLTRENQGNKKDIHSNIAQRKLLPLASNVSSKTLFRDFFCDEKTNPDCKYPSGQWGGSRDDFVVQEKYAAFVKEHLMDLRDWSKTFFKENSQTVYWVHKYSFNPYGNPTIPYDFDRNGYWMDVFPSRNNRNAKGFQFYGNGNNESFFFEFLPETAYGNKHLNRMTDPNRYWPKMLMKIPPGEAEALINRKTKDLYATIKVNIVFKEVNEVNMGSPQLTYTFHLASPSIVFYEDVEL
ncbi:MAG: hypothetical protein AAFO99_16310, partial [Bacteroidota bacterium]